jgi:hypothetical protein
MAIPECVVATQQRKGGNGTYSILIIPEEKSTFRVCCVVFN